MTQHELDTILQSGEGYKTEFKRNVNSDLSKEFAAFANSSGGRVLLGIEDDGTVSGVTIDNTLKSKVAMMAQECDPSIPVELEAFNNVLIVHVPEGKNKPYRCTNGFYIRNGASSTKLGTAEIIDFIQSEGKIKFDELRNKAAQYPVQLNTAAVAWYRRLSGITASLTDDELLINLGVVYPDEPAAVINNTGVLFFMQNPTRYIPQSIVTAVLYKGNIKVTIIDRKDFAFNLIENIEETISFLKRHLNLAYEIKETVRREIMEIPEVALREAVINAVAHRDYFEKGANVVVEIYDNRVEISNPGGLAKGLKPEEFGKRAISRNPLITALLNRAGYIEKLGTGVLRIREAMAAAGLPEPEFSFTGFFTVTLQRVHTPEKAISLSLDVTPRRLERMMYLLRQLEKGGGIDLKEASKKFEVVEQALRKDLQLLNRKGWVTTTGSTSSRTYKLATQAIEQFNTSTKASEV